MSVSYGDPIFNPIFLTHLLPYLTPISYIMLRRANPKFFATDKEHKRYPSVAAVCLERCERALSQAFPLTPDLSVHFMQLLRAGTITLTGGALLSLLQGEPIDLTTQDIDIACSGHALAAVCVSGMTDRVQAFSDGAFNDHYQVVGLEFRSATGLIATGDIFVLDDPIAVLPREFDLSICGNVLCAKRLLLRDALGVLHRRCSVELNRYLRSVRLDAKATEVEEKFLHRLARREKYRGRGYQIDVITDWSLPAVLDGVREVRVWVPQEEAPKIMGRDAPGWSWGGDNTEHDAYWREAQDRYKPLMQQTIYNAWKKCWEQYRK
jgi:hypothetical protein